MKRHVAISRLVVNGALAVGCGAAAWRMLSQSLAMACLFAALAAACTVALACRWGAVVPCLTIGLVLGILLDVGPKGGTAESQMWEMVESWVGGGLLGLLVGVAMDWQVGRHVRSED